MVSNIEEHEEKYYHISKKIGIALFSMMIAFLLFWWGIFVFGPFTVEYSNVILVPYSVSLIFAFVMYALINKIS